MPRYGLRDDQWQRIKDLMPGRIGHVGVTAQDNRRFVEAVVYRYQRRPGCGNGCLSTSPARPTTNTPCSTARSCGRTSTAPALPKKDEDQAIGQSRGGLSTKIHALVDALGNPLAFLL